MYTTKYCDTSGYMMFASQTPIYSPSSKDGSAYDLRAHQSSSISEFALIDPIAGLNRLVRRIIRFVLPFLTLWSHVKNGH